MRNSNAIKNLCIALEALSRIPDSYETSRRVQKLLDHCIEEDISSTENPDPMPRPVIDTNLDDNIPF